MRNRIRSHYPHSDISTRESSSFYVADFSMRTKKARGVEIHSTIPACPINPDKKMDCMEVSNSASIKIDFNVFNDHQFKDAQGNDIEHCEGCFYPTVNHDKSWIAMVEIKDCSPNQIIEYKDKVISQIVSATMIFRSKQIITSHKVYGIISVPRKKVSFNNTIFGMPPNYTELKRKHNILFAAANKVLIVDDTRIKCIE